MNDLGDRVMREIEQRQLKPKPLSVFLARRFVMWTLFVLAVLLGAVAVAFVIFLGSDLLTTGGKGFDEMPFDDVAVLLPALAAAAFAAFSVSAALFYRKTRRGYRIRPAVAAAAAAAMSLVAGFALHEFEIDRTLHQALAAKFPSYAAYARIPYAEWSEPQNGKLGGAAIEMLGKELRLRDFTGKEWIIDLSGAIITFEETPVEEGDVAVTGQVTGPNHFKADKVEPFD
jgi:hypothetical protein